MVTRILSLMMSSRHVRSLLLAAVVATLPVFSACERSNSEKANENAAQAAHEAARLTLSAGELRATADLMKRDFSAPGSYEAAKAEVEKKIGGDVGNANGAWKEFLEQRTVAADLKIALDGLGAALKSTDFDDPAFLQLVQAQIGATSAAAAANQLNSLSTHLLNLTERAATIESLAQRVNTFGIYADTSAKKPGMAALTDELNAKKTKLDAATADAAAKSSGVTSLEADIAAKQAKANEIYEKSDADIAHAENLKGTAAIAASKIAGEARKEADLLTEQVVNLLPQLAAAKNDLQISQTQLQEIKFQVEGLIKAADDAAVNTKATDAYTTAQRTEARKLVDGSTGLAAQVKTLSELVTTIETEVAVAGKSAENSEKGYRDALAKLQAYQSQVVAKFADSKTGADADPLLKLAQDKAPVQLMQLQQAEARQQMGRVHVAAWAASSLQKTALDAAAVAHKNAGLSLSVPSDLADTAKAESLAAIKEFDAALDLVKTATAGAKDTSSVKWLGETLRAVSYHGKYVVSGDSADKASASASAKEAMRLNPRLQLTYLVSAN